MNPIEEMMKIGESFPKLRGKNFVYCDRIYVWRIQSRCVPTQLLGRREEREKREEERVKEWEKLREERQAEERRIQGERELAEMSEFLHSHFLQNSLAGF